MSDLQTVVSDDATHLLRCKHCYGKAETTYWMKCLPLNKTKGGNLKVIVFGRLYWGGEDKRIRYVEPHRVKPIAAH